MATALDYFKLEVAFSDGPDVASPTWTDITAYWRMVVDVNITRGRNSEQDDITPGTLSLALDNTDGRFTAGYTGGAYYPNVKLRRQIRITWREGGAGTVYDIFRGHVDEWPTEWPTGDDTFSHSIITATDRTARLGQLLPLRGVPQESILADSPRCYFPLTEPSTATVAGDITLNAATTALSPVQQGAGGKLSFGGGTGPSTDGVASLLFEPVSGANGKYLRATSAQYNDIGVTTSFQFEFAFAADTAVTSATLVTFTPTDPALDPLSVTLASGALSVGSTTINFVTAGFASNDGLVHHVGVTVTASGGGGALTLYVDGVSAGTTTSGWTSVLPTYGRLEVGGSTTTAALAQLSVSHLAVGTYNHWDAILNGYAGESSNARITRYAGWVGMGSFLNLDTGSSTSLSHIDATGRTAFDVMKDVAATENGQVFASRDGKITFHNRTRRYNAAVAMTVSTANRDIGEAITFRTNDQYLVNDVTVTSTVNGTNRVTDSASIADYGYARQDFEVFTTNASEASGAASWRVATRSTPLPRAERLEVDMLAATSASRVSAVQLDISSRITLSGLPSTAPASTADLFVEGYTESIGLNGWTRTFNTSPATVAGSVWQLNVAGKSELNTTARLAY